MSSFLQGFVAVAIVGAFVAFLIRVSVLALILRIFTKKYKLRQNYGKAWLAILIPSVVVSLLAIPLVLAELPSFLIIIVWFLFFPILIFSVKLVYKTRTGVSAKISFKFFLVILVLLIAVAGIQTLIGGVSNPLKSNVPQAVCTLDCEFAYSLKDYQEGPLIVRGYNIPAGKFQEKEGYIIGEKNYSETEFNNMKAGWKDVNGDDRVYGKLNVTGCNWMGISRGSPTTGGVSCQRSSKNFLTNLQKILVG